MQDGQYPTKINSSAPNVNVLNVENNPVSALSLALQAGAKPLGSGNTNSPAEQPVVILPQFAGLPKEQGVIRTLQSIKDNLMRENNELKGRIDEQSSYVTFAQKLTTDPELQMAFVRTYQPELLKEVSVENKVQDQLKKDFGDDFKPVSEDENKRGTPTNRYWRKYDVLTEKFEKENVSGASLSTLTELADKRKKETKTRNEKYATKIKKLKTDKNLTDSDVMDLHKFMGTLEVEHFWDILQFQKQFGNTGTKPNLNSISDAGVNFNSGQQATTQKMLEVEQYVTNILGPAPSK